MKLKITIALGPVLKIALSNSVVRGNAAATRKTCAYVKVVLAAAPTPAKPNVPNLTLSPTDTAS